MAWIDKGEGRCGGHVGGEGRRGGRQLGKIG